MKRLFAAIDLPERIIDDICATYQAIPGARWMREEQLHLTLRFYGETSTDQEESLMKALAKITLPPFFLSLKGTGFFPPRKEARILWIGTAQQPLLLRLQALVEKSSVACGFARDRRRFFPHISVARLKAAHPDRIARYLVENSLLKSELFEVRAFHLYSSHLGKEGAHYIREVTFEFNS
jgi:2'-5' RNA ligase